LNAKGTAASSWLLQGLNYAVSMGATLSSNSYGGQGWGGIQETTRILNKHPKHLFISAAGNKNEEVQGYYTPCAVQTSNSICVASSTKDDTKSSFSNYDSSYVHVFAPGSDIVSTVPIAKNSYSYMSGTSMACPMVSGLAAMMMSMRGDVSPAEIKELIELNVQKKAKYSPYVSTGGLIDVDKTISALMAAYDSKPVCKNDESDSWCDSYKWACTSSNYPWFRNSCKKTCNNC
jgi:subtilisin family serine protease